MIYLNLTSNNRTNTKLFSAVFKQKYACSIKLLLDWIWMPFNQAAAGQSPCKMCNSTYHDELQNSKRRPWLEKMMTVTSVSQSSESSYAFLSSPFWCLANVTCPLTSVEGESCRRRDGGPRSQWSAAACGGGRAWGPAADTNAGPCTGGCVLGRLGTGSGGTRRRPRGRG
jgi:hypothetical protein